PMTRIPFALSLIALLGSGGLGSVARGQVRDPYRVVVVTRPSVYGGYYYGPYSLAATIEAMGNYPIKMQQAARLREENRQKRLQTRRKEWEQWEWERNFRA